MSSALSTTRSRDQTSRPASDSSARRAAAQRMGAAFARGRLEGEERRIALDLLARLARDLEVEVREALVEQVKECPFLPPALARELAADVESVAAPLIRCTPVLDDQDLIEIVRGGSRDKQLAVAGRMRLSTEVSAALVDTRAREVVGAVLANPGAEIAERSFERVLETFGEDESIQSLLVERPSLPETVAARLISEISEALRERLIERHAFPPVLAEELVGLSRERALCERLRAATTPEDKTRVLAQIQADGALSPTLLLRSLAGADLTSFEHALARLAEVPAENASRLARDAGRDGFWALYRQAGLPPQLFPAFRIALDAALVSAESNDWLANAPVECGDAVIEEICAGWVKTYDELGPGSLENMLSQFARRLRSPAWSQRAAN